MSKSQTNVIFNRLFPFWGSLMANMLAIAMLRIHPELALRSYTNIALFHIWLLYSLFSLLLYLRTENYRPFQSPLLTPVPWNVFLLRQRLPGCYQAAHSNTNQREQRTVEPIAGTWRHEVRNHMKRKKIQTFWRLVNSCLPGKLCGVANDVEFW